ncbi:MAG: DUF4835 family protein [Bacteroidota bacterium]|nr:DUF4835 family protein [Bacteroidota bacterium]
MLQKLTILFLFFSITFNSNAQELQAKVSVNPSKINTTVDKKIFTTLQTQLINFLNSRKWTNDQFNDNEKIQCNFLINLQSIVEPNVYRATLIIQAARPVFNTSYQAALVNFQDQDFTFKYIEYQPIEFNDNRVQGTDALVGNLTAVFAYYINIILGLDYDSFAPKGGDIYFQRALNIVNNAPEGSSISGWQAFDGLRNRYWLSENLTNSRNNIVHDVIYSYYRSGLDKMYDAEKEARNNILQALVQLQAFNKEVPNTMIVEFLLQTKVDELIGIFKNGTSDEKSKAIEILSLLDVSNASRYKDELR